VAEKKDKSTVSPNETSRLEERVVVLEKLVDNLGEEFVHFRHFVESMIGRMGGDASGS